MIYGTYFPAHHKTLSTVTIYRQGNLISVSRGKQSESNKKRSHGGERTEIQTFSRKSRRKLMREIAMMDKRLLPLFVTLTYPAEYPENHKEYKGHLKLFASRMKRAFQQSGFIWRLEFQRRGAPHYHLLVYGVNGDFQEWASFAWYSVIGSSDQNHLKSGVFIVHLENYRHLGSYIGKISKPSDARYCGRHWGMYHRENLKRYKSEQVIYEISEKQAIEIIRYLRKLARIKSRTYPSLTVFSDGKFWSECIEKTLNDEPHPRGVIRSNVFRRDIYKY